MADKTLNVRVKMKTDTSANWAQAVNFVPLKGELIVYSDLKKIKIGDGTTKVSVLDFIYDKDATQSASGLMTAADKTKLDGIETNANKYTLPAATSSALGGVIVGTNISNSSGTISLTKANVTSALGYTPPSKDTTYSLATTSANGLMSSADKSKLDNLSNYSLTADKITTAMGYKPADPSKYLLLTGGTVTGTTTLGGAGGFNYSGIQSATANSSRVVWFASSDGQGIPVYSANFKYNPSSNVLTVGSITGNAANVTGTVAVDHGGTGATTPAVARNKLGVLGSVLKNDYEGMTTMDGTDTTWIRTTSLGLIPYQSGGATNGHARLGTSSWYFQEAYIQKVYNTENHIGDCTMTYNYTTKALEFNFA